MRPALVWVVVTAPESQPAWIQLSAWLTHSEALGVAHELQKRGGMRVTGPFPMQSVPLTEGFLECLT